MVHVRFSCYGLSAAGRVSDMIIDVVKQMLARQFKASLATLGVCVSNCPDELWDVQIARYPFYQVAFHTLIFADLYLGLDAESLQQQAFHLANRDMFRDYEQLEDREPVLSYDRRQITTYLEFCQSKAARTIAAETEASLSAPAKFERKKCSRADLHVENIRHIQHHAAQLILRLRLDADIDVPWI